MPDDRDKLNRSTPPPHVAEQIAAPLEKRDRAGTNPDSFEDETPVFGDPVQQINKRAQAAAGAARGAWGAIREVRAEVKESHRQLNERVDRVTDRMTEMSDTIGDIRGTVGEISGQMRFLVDHHRATQKVVEETTIVKVKTETEVAAEQKKADIEITAEVQKAAIEEAKEERAHRRKKTMWLLGAVGSVITALAGLLAAVRC